MKTINRTELYQLVWSKPISIISKDLEVSYHQLIDACTVLNVPRPKSGYWQKLKFNKQVNVINLDKDYQGLEKFTFDKFCFKSSDNPEKIFRTPLEAKMYEIENDEKVCINVKDRLSKPDELIKARQQAIKNWKAKRKSGDYSSYPNNIIRLNVSDKNESRALRIMDAFIKMAKARGHEVYCDGSTYFLVKGEKMDINLVEKRKRVLIKEEKYNWTRTDYEYTGVLAFRYKNSYHPAVDWGVGLTPLENLLSKIMAKVEIEADKRIEEQKQLEKIWAEQRIKTKLRQEKEKLIQDELIAFKELLSNAEKWDVITKVRNYINEMEKRVSSDEDANWIKWARRKVEWYEPNSKVEDELLNYVDKDTLTFNRYSLS
ncbi:hypothetical protein N9E20_01735 [Crocinitomicaceae bacterium]|nr:hypothetical protein [Crocinitomicaceae bacterium]